MSRHHDTSSRYEEPDFSDDSVARCIRCDDIHDVEEMTMNIATGDFTCAECQEIYLAEKREQQSEETIE